MTVVPRGRAEISAVLAAMLLLGCSSAPDPRDGGLLNGVIGVVGGGYSRRIEERYQTYVGLTAEQEALIAEARGLEQERGELRGELDRVGRELARLDAELRRKQGKLADTGRDPARRRAMDQVEVKIRGGKTRVHAAHRDNVPVARMRRELDSLRQELKDIDNLIQTMSQDAG